MLPVSCVRGGVLLVLLCMCGVVDHAEAQRNSPVFRGYRPPRVEAPTAEEGMRRQWSDFLLTREASAGDAEAQHELGLRYLFGRGFPADTAAAALWIARAAAQELIAARYNYGLLLVNGWGVQWNPFAAYAEFRAAAVHGMPEARYIVGSMYTDNLVVARDWRTAARWVKLAADAGHPTARAVLADMLARGVISPADTVTGGRIPDEPAPRAEDGIGGGSGSGGTSQGRPRGRWAPVYLDFSADTAIPPPDLAGLWEIVRGTMRIPAEDSAAIERLLQHGGAARREGGTDGDAGAPLRTVAAAAAAGNGDAVCFLATCRRDGVLLARDPIRAVAGYARAMFLEAQYAGPLLSAALADRGLLPRLERRAAEGDAEAQYAVAALAALGVARSADERTASALLGRAVSARHDGALVLAGINAAAGRWTARDPARARELWRSAAAEGSREAAVRAAAHDILRRAAEDAARTDGNAGGPGIRGTAGASADAATEIDTISAALDTLRAAAADGVVLATVALATAFRHGIGVLRSDGEASRLYREAAIRGSRSAARALRAMHDALRPANARFDAPE